MKSTVTRRGIMITRKAQAQAEVVHKWGSEIGDSTTYTVACDGKTAWIRGGTAPSGITGSSALLVALADAIYDVVDAMKVEATS